MAGPPHQAGISRLVRLDREPPSEELYADGSYEGPAQNRLCGGSLLNSPAMPASANRHPPLPTATGATMAWPSASWFRTWSPLTFQLHCSIFVFRPSGPAGEAASC